MDCSQTTPSSPAPKMTDSHFQFAFSDAAADLRKQKAARSDPVAEALQALEGLDVEQINQKIWDKRLFQGMGTDKEAILTIQNWLEAAWLDASGKSHRELAGEATFNLHLLAPLPWVRAVEAIAGHDGVDPESLNLALDANLGWLEHHSTRLRHSEDSTHKGVSTAPSVMLGAAVSAKKSHIIELTDGFLADAEPLDDEGNPGYVAQRSLVVSDATLAGLRKTLRKYSRAIVTSSEASTVYETPFSTKRPGIHYLPEQVMNKLTQSEMDDAQTASGETHLGSQDMPYLLLHKISGQQDRSIMSCPSGPGIHFLFLFFKHLGTSSAK